MNFFLIMFLQHVRRAAVLALSTAAHNKPNLIKRLLPELLPLLYDQTVVKVVFLFLRNFFLKVLVGREGNMNLKVISIELGYQLTAEKSSIGSRFNILFFNKIVRFNLFDLGYFTIMMSL